jgi:hypothetical protein
MNPLVAQMTGRRVQEDVPVPVAACRSEIPNRRKDRRSVQRRTAAAMMGMREDQDQDQDGIIPGDADEVDNYGGPAGTKVDHDKVEDDETPDDAMTPASSGYEEETGELIAPSAALVAPDVTPHTLEPLDPSQVPAPKQPAAAPAPPAAPAATGQPPIDPMDVLLGRRSGRQPMPPEETAPPVTTEAAQATINATLGVSGPGDLLGQGREMPPPAPGDAKKVMEAFYRFGNAHRA